jgi:hypothetical protein
MRARSRTCTFACCGALGLEESEASANQAFQYLGSGGVQGWPGGFLGIAIPYFPLILLQDLSMLWVLAARTPRHQASTTQIVDNARPCSGLCVLAHRDVDNLMKRVLRSSRYYVYVAVGLLLRSWFEGLLGLTQASVDKVRVALPCKHMLRSINPQIYHRRPCALLS